MFEGSIVALVTPFRNGAVDETAFRRLIRFHIENGTDGILVAGCTGEAANLSLSELKQMISWAKDELKDSPEIKLLAGTGTNATSTTIERTIAAAELGVDGILLITPYYNKPTPAGQIAHYTAVAEKIDTPIILYNVPGRTGTNMLPETMAELYKVPNIVAVKEAGGNVDQVSRLSLLAPDMVILSGDDTLTLPMMSVGAKGVISVTANIAPHWVSEMCRAWIGGEPLKALDFHQKLFPVSKAMFIETNPLPVKAALHLMGLIENELRLPLVPAGVETVEKIKSVLVQSGLLSEESK